METSEQAQSELDSTWKNSLRIWKGGFAFLALYFIAAFILQPMLRKMFVPENSSPEWLGYVIYALLGLTVLNLLVLVAVRWTILKPGGDADQQSAARKHLSATVLTASFLEGIGMFGVIAFILTKDILALLLFIGLAAASMFWFRPDKERLLDLDRQMRKGA